MKLRTLCVTAAVIAAAVGVTSPVAAAGPANDDIAGATPIGFETPIVQDITDATVTPDEPLCDAGVTNNVWFTFTATAREYVWVTVDANAGEWGPAWSPSAWISGGIPEPSMCGPASLITTPGVTYFIPVGNTAWWAEPPLVATVTLHHQQLAQVSVKLTEARALSDGTGLFTFTIRCDTAVVVDANVWVSQTIGNRFRVPGYGYSYTSCTPGVRSLLQVQITPDAGRFGGGRVEMQWYWSALGAPVDAPGGLIYQTVTMRG